MVFRREVAMSSCFCHAALLMVLSVVPIWAQISTGTIRGVVEDSSAEVIPNAEVTVTQTATGETRMTRTTASGEFNVPFLQVGQYAVSVTAGGFKTKTFNGLNLQGDQTINLPHPPPNRPPTRHAAGTRKNTP